MAKVNISGYGDDLTVNGVRIGDLSPAEHEAIEMEKGGQNYSPLEDVVVSHVMDSSTLICRKPDPDGVKAYIEEELLDGLCCYSAVNQGQLNATIVDAVIAHLQDEKIPTVPRSIRHKYMAAFLLAATAITEMDKVVPKVAGVEAPELMAKLSRRWGYRVKGIPANEAIIVVAADNFHGRSLFAVSASTDPMAKDDFGPFLPGIEVVPFNDIEALKALFKEKGDRIASYIVEPIQGEAGVILPTADYHQQVADLCKQHNVLFCMDEVQTGFARTGANFAHQLYGVKPDLMACGKAAGGGIMPVSFVAGRKDVINVLTPGSEGSTFGGFPLASVTATFAIKAMVDMNLAQNAEKMGQRMIQHFNDIKADYPDKIKEGRGAGLLTAFEMYDEPGLDGHKVSLKLLESGIYAKETHKTTVRLAPALTVTEAGVDHIGESIRKVIHSL
ncbi:MAG: aminotransferase class III-fold pyridoxal phosphate-dependent enzyme [Candidatus Marinimicrobia bacterium]|nr:aminotransferase class III-fold pyridoxal phosphate-dependent enzyme [Candidatus Neomarinimicrobiota bacterium]MCF7850123.1 aminotransferase class III-fold pyridoxal phosphate-dependent enzyme [Candidatus Neomarinimicrobiota bacterium]MCF7905461.1 aminotransferase class III-fold pyridoxal phosphate-dependent enzyme [Candidatus Neomarinimicrobiota bacterium]